MTTDVYHVRYNGTPLLWTEGHCPQWKWIKVNRLCGYRLFNFTHYKSFRGAEENEEAKKKLA
ncbi:U-exon [Bearded dragon adenovirus 1]|uniref:U-exon n=1 Tax=Bearded dragon adenovirus 1 TaxID=2729647 RepID=A0A6M4MJI4_9ADEN|nr:U-exon [Bearded dragon adenovirus 1]QJR83103.1 U-exon [Bearded dragon adenovirus 1]QRN77605.1 U-exon [Bearded dragon adenovirus 1]